MWISGCVLRPRRYSAFSQIPWSVNICSRLYDNISYVHHRNTIQYPARPVRTTLFIYVCNAFACVCKCYLILSVLQNIKLAALRVFPLLLPIHFGRRFSLVSAADSFALTQLLISCLSVFWMGILNIRSCFSRVVLFSRKEILVESFL